MDNQSTKPTNQDNKAVTSEPVKTTLPVAPPAPAAPKDVPLPPIDNWPGAVAIYKYSRQVVRFNIGTYAGLFAISVILAIINGLVKRHSAGLFLSLIIYILTFIISIAYITALLAGARSKKISFNQALKNGLDPMLILKFIGLYIVLTVVIVISFLLLIIPYFFVFPRLILSPYFLVDKKMGIIDSLKASWNFTKGSSSKVWGIIVMTIVMALPVITIIGIPVTIYLIFMYSAALTLLYEFINKAQPHPQAVVATPSAAPENPAPGIKVG